MERLAYLTYGAGMCGIKDRGSDDNMVEEKERTGKSGKKALISLILSFFLILGCLVFLIATRITKEMSQSAIGNLSESLNLLKGTIEVLIKREA